MRIIHVYREVEGKEYNTYHVVPDTFLSDQVDDKYRNDVPFEEIVRNSINAFPTQEEADAFRSTLLSC